jgi:hypothetical protein
LRTVVESARAALDGLLLADCDNVHWDGIELQIISNVMRRSGRKSTYTQALEEVFGFAVDLELS